MARPPPPPPSALSSEARARLLGELSVLDLPELMALCADVDVLSHGREELARDRLHLYLTVLRGRPGTRAQFAALLVGFELARRGEPTAQRELAALVPVARDLVDDPALGGALVAADPFLAAAYAGLGAWLAESHDTAHALEEGVPDAGTLELTAELGVDLPLPPPLAAPAEAEEVALDDEAVDVVTEEDDDVLLVDDEEPLDPRHEAAREAFAAALLRYMGHEPTKGRFRFGGGFQTDSSGDLDRLEAFARDCLGHGAAVPVAAGLAWLLPLHAAASMKRTTLFGRPNARRTRLLQDGLSRFPAELAGLVGAAEVVNFEGPDAREGFAKLLDAVMEFFAFCARKRLDPRAPESARRFAAGD